MDQVEEDVVTGAQFGDAGEVLAAWAVGVEPTLTVLTGRRGAQFLGRGDRGVAFVLR